jgi:excisionase family DNA binding protein
MMKAQVPGPQDGRVAGWPGLRDWREGVWMSESIRALATVTLDARALEELGEETIDRLADLVEARLVERRASGNEPLLTAAAAAELAGVHASTVRRAIREGVLEAAGYVGSRPRVRRAAVEAWVAGGSLPASSSPRSRRVASGGARPAGRVLGEALREMDASGEHAA